MQVIYCNQLIRNSTVI